MNETANHSGAPTPPPQDLTIEKPKSVGIKAMFKN